MGPEGLTWQDDKKLWSDVNGQREVREMQYLKVYEQNVNAFILRKMM